jgi:hypothetical protein
MDQYERILLSDKLESAEDIDAALSGAADDHHGTATEYVVRVSPSLFRTVSMPKVTELQGAWDTVVRRLKGKSLVLIPALPTIPESLGDPQLLDCIDWPLLRLTGNDQGSDSWKTLSDVETADIREADLEAIVASASVRSILTLGTGHFELPSGAHTSHFLRLAECLADLDTVDRIVQWIARNVARTVRDLPSKRQLAILVDNPSMLVLALRFSQLFPSTRVLCHCLPAYPESADAGDEMTAWLEQRLPNDCTNLLSIVGVSSTGALQRLVSASCDSLSVKAQFCVLFSTTDTTSEVYCRLNIDGYAHFSEDAECPMCKEESPVFKIDRARYFLHEHKVDTVPLPIRLFDPQREFLAKYGSTPGVLLTHADDPNDSNPRHHAFYVSVSALLKQDGFREELRDRLKDFPIESTLVLIPPHPTGREIAGFVESLGFRVRFHSDLRIRVEEEAERLLADEISACQTMVIIDDLAFSGSRLRAFSRSIREAGRVFQAPKEIIFLPLVVLAESVDDWGKVRRGLEANHPDQTRKLTWLYQLQLPNWDKTTCPWCSEQRELERLPALTADDTDEQGARLLKPQGLESDTWINHLLRLVVPAFGANSPILPAGSNAIQVLFSCAAAVQQARTSGPPSKRLNAQGFPIAVLLDAAVMQNFQNEMLIVVSLLRCLKRNELSDALRTYLRSLTLDLAGGRGLHDEWALRELLLAEKRGLIPRVKDAGDRARVYARAQFDAYFKP